mmetsp:Transcript_61044/g.176825  ORF Transcript_61044/g.176825 Transcript_61044/m.176825 type:complete len:256 (-) Transcript_61044:459-1226(-)
MRGRIHRLGRGRFRRALVDLLPLRHAPGIHRGGAVLDGLHDRDHRVLARLLADLLLGRGRHREPAGGADPAADERHVAHSEAGAEQGDAPRGRGHVDGVRGPQPPGGVPQSERGRALVLEVHSTRGGPALPPARRRGAARRHRAQREHLLLRHRRLDHDLRADAAGRGPQAAQRVFREHGVHHHRGAGHHARIHRRRHSRHLERPERRARPRNARRHLRREDAGGVDTPPRGLGLERQARDPCARGPALRPGLRR